MLQLLYDKGVFLFVIDMSQCKTKPTIKPVWPAKTPISLYIHPVWRGFSFIPLWIPWRLLKAQAISEDSDQIVHPTSMARILVYPSL